MIVEYYHTEKWSTENYHMFPMKMDFKLKTACLKQVQTKEVEIYLM